MTDPRTVPCDQVLTKLWEYLDEELGEASCERVRSHLRVCSNCFPQYDFQRAYLLFVEKTRCQAMPLELRKRIFRMILEEDARVRTPAPETGSDGGEGWSCRADGEG